MLITYTYDLLEKLLVSLHPTAVTGILDNLQNDVFSVLDPVSAAHNLYWLPLYLRFRYRNLTSSLLAYSIDLIAATANHKAMRPRIRQD